MLIRRISINTLHAVFCTLAACSLVSAQDDQENIKPGKGKIIFEIYVVWFREKLSARPKAKFRSLDKYISFLKIQSTVCQDHYVCFKLFFKDEFIVCHVKFLHKSVTSIHGKLIKSIKSSISKSYMFTCHVSMFSIKFVHVILC